MKKIQTIYMLLLCLILFFSIDMIFGNIIRETFSNETETETETSSNDLGIVSNEYTGDDQPSYYGF